MHDSIQRNKMMQYTSLSNSGCEPLAVWAQCRLCVCVCVCFWALGCGAVCRRGGGGWIINAVWSLDPTCSDYWAEQRPFYGPAELMPMIRSGGLGWSGWGLGVGEGLKVEGCCGVMNWRTNSGLPSPPSAMISLSLSFPLALFPLLLSFSTSAPRSSQPAAMWALPWQRGPAKDYGDGARERDRKREREEGCSSSMS